MSDEQLVERLVQQVVARLSPESLWEMTQGCRMVCVEKDADRVRYIVECGAERLGLKAEGASLDQDLARYIDHTLLKANAAEKEIEKLCDEARMYGFAAVCVNPCWVRAARRRLEGSSVRVCTVAGFPLGASMGDVKAFEARRSIYDGATEIDMVINIGVLKSGDDTRVRDDIGGVVAACHDNGAICKVILETALLSDEEKVKACTLSKEVGADFVKTSTGFGPGGATAADVALMRRTVGPALGVKAAGGIKDSADTRQMIEAGATRIGASAGIKIVSGERASGGY